MIRFGKPLPRVAAIAGALWLSGCVEADKAGTPHLVAFEIMDATGSPVMKDPDAAVFTASPRVSFRAVFSDLLDFTQIVDVDAGTGLPGLVTLQAAGNPSISTIYTPNGHYKYSTPPFFGTATTGPNIAAIVAPGLPSGVPVLVTLDISRLKGHNGSPLVVDPGVLPTIMFQTESFGVAGEKSEMPFAADHAFVLTASNLLGETFASKVTATSTVGAAVKPEEVVVTPSMEDPAQFTVAPKSGMWPAGAKITVTIATDAADQFGAALGAAVAIDFMVAAPTAAP